MRTFSLKTFLLQFCIISRLLFQISSPALKCQLDIGFALDESGSILDEYLKQEREFVAKFIEIIGPSDTQSHTSLMTFATGAKVAWLFNDREGTNKEAALASLKQSYSRTGYATCINKALNIARIEVFSKEKVRKNVAKIFILISDGRGNCVDSKTTIEMAKHLKDEGVYIMTIGVGKSIDTEELKKIASGPELFFLMTDFTQLVGAVSVLADKACEKQTNPPPPKPVQLETVSDAQVKAQTNKAVFQFGVLIENSNQVTKSNFEILKKVPILLMQSLHASMEGTQVSVMFYDVEANHIVKFGEEASYDISLMSSKINAVKPSTSYMSCSQTAMRKVASDMFTSDDPSITKILLVVISNPNNCYGLENLGIKSSTVKKSGVVVFVLAIEDKVGIPELLIMASGGSNIFHVEFIQQIQKHILKVIEKSIIYNKETITHSLKTINSLTVKPEQMNLRVDMAIVFENTGGITDDHFEAVKMIISLLIQSAGIKEHGSRVSLVSYGDDYKIHWDLDSQTAGNLDIAISSLVSITRPRDRRICIEKGLEAVHDKIFTESTLREGVPRVMILIGLHISTCGGLGRIRAWADKLTARNIFSHSIGYDYFVSDAELSAIATEIQYYWKIYTKSHIVATVNSIIKISTEICHKYAIKSAKHVHVQAVPNSIDVGFILTDSITINEPDFHQLIDSIIDSISKLDIGERKSRVSVMINTKFPKLLWTFTDKQATDQESANELLLKYRRTTETTSCLDQSIDKARDEMFNDDYKRSGVTKMLVIITTESSICVDNSVYNEKVNLLKNSGVYIVVIGVGANVDQQRLEFTSTSHNLYFYYTYVAIYKITIQSFVRYISTNEFKIKIEAERRVPLPPPAYIPEEDKPTPMPPLCEIDLGFIVDESISVSSTDFDGMKDVTVSMIDMLNPQKSKAHTAFMLMSLMGRMVYNFTSPEGSSAAESKKLIQEVQQNKVSSTCFGSALEYASEVMFAPENTRSDAQKALLLLSDGGESCSDDDEKILVKAKQHLNDDKIYIYTVGIGSGIDDRLLKKIATSEETYFPVDNFQALANSVKNLLNKFCEEKPPPVPLEPPPKEEEDIEKPPPLPLKPPPEKEEPEEIVPLLPVEPPPLPVKPTPEEEEPEEIVPLLPVEPPPLPVKPTPEEEEHEEEIGNCNVRILFQIDITFETKEDYMEIINHVSLMIKNFMKMKNKDIIEVTSQTAVIIYGKTPTILWDFESRESRDSHEAIEKLKSTTNNPGPKSCLGKSLKEAKEHIFKEKSTVEDITDVTVIIGQAFNNCADEDMMKTYKTKLEKHGVNILEIIVGTYIELDLYKQLVTQEDFFFNIPTTKDIKRFDTSLVNLVCTLPPLPPSSEIHKIPYDPAPFIPAPDDPDVPVPGIPGPYIPDIPGDPDRPYNPEPKIKLTPGEDPFSTIESCNARLVIITDDSGADNSEYSILKTAVKDIFSTFMSRINQDAGRVTSKTSMMAYSEHTEILWDFNSFESTDINQALLKITDHKQLTSTQSCTSVALLGALTDIYSETNTDPTSSDVLILIAAKKDNCKDFSEALLTANALKTKNIVIIVITVGDDPSLEVFAQIASSSDLYMKKSSYSDLVDITRNMVDAICQILPVPLALPEPPPEPSTEITEVKPEPDLPPEPPKKEEEPDLPPIYPKKKEEPKPLVPLIGVDTCDTRLAIIMDDSIESPIEYTAMKASVREIIHKFMKRVNQEEGAPSAQTALISYSESAHKIWDFTDRESADFDKAEEKLNELTKSKNSESCTDTGLKVALSKVFTAQYTTNVDGKPNVVLLITSKPNTCGTDTQALADARRLGEKGVTTIVFAMGENEEVKTLKELASTPDLYFRGEHYRDLLQLSDDIVEMVCQAKPNPPVDIEEEKPTRPKIKPSQENINLIMNPPHPEPEIFEPVPSYLTVPKDKPRKRPEAVDEPPSDKPPDIPHETFPGAPSGPPSGPSSKKPSDTPPGEDTPPDARKVRVVLKVCADMLVRPIGCLSKEFLKYFNNPLNKPICLDNLPCQISIGDLKDEFCKCSKKSRILGQNAFAFGANGQCFGNDFLHKIPKRSILPSEYCKRNDMRRCRRTDHTCLGGRNSIYVYSNA